MKPAKKGKPFSIIFSELSKDEKHQIVCKNPKKAKVKRCGLIASATRQGCRISTNIIGSTVYFWHVDI